jgi:hypothetical protein
MKSFVGIIGLLVFMLILTWITGSFIGEIQARMAECSEARVALGLCK